MVRKSNKFTTRTPSHSTQQIIIIYMVNYNRYVNMLNLLLTIKYSAGIFFLQNLIKQKKLEAQWAEPVQLTFHSALRKLNTEPSIGILVHLAKRFQRRRFQKSTNQKQELPMAAMFANGSGRNDQSLQRTLRRCFIPSFISFGQALSEEKILEINQSETRTACGGHVC